MSFVINGARHLLQRSGVRNHGDMNTIISTLIGTLCLSVIVGADTGHPLALRLQGAVAVLVDIGNALMLLQAAAQGHFVHVYVDRASQRPVPIPEPVRAVLQTLVGTPA